MLREVILRKAKSDDLFGCTGIVCLDNETRLFAGEYVNAAGEVISFTGVPNIGGFEALDRQSAVDMDAAVWKTKNNVGLLTYLFGWPDDIFLYLSPNGDEVMVRMVGII